MKAEQGGVEVPQEVQRHAVANGDWKAAELWLRLIANKHVAGPLQLRDRLTAIGAWRSGRAASVGVPSRRR